MPAPGLGRARGGNLQGRLLSSSSSSRSPSFFSLTLRPSRPLLCVLFLCVSAFVYGVCRVPLPFPVPSSVLVAMAATASGYIDEQNCCATSLFFGKQLRRLSNVPPIKLCVRETTCSGETGDRTATFATAAGKLEKERASVTS